MRYDCFALFLLGIPKPLSFVALSFLLSFVYILVLLYHIFSYPLVASQ